MFKLHCFLFLTSAILKVLAVPPAICREEFNWNDCGKPPKAVMYYWKQGSRCEIGFWKGCLPNPNMFADEYECINTCVFVDRPSPRQNEEEETETESPNTTVISNVTETTSSENVTVTENPGNTTGDPSTASTNDTSSNDTTGSEGNVTTEAETTEATTTPAA